MSKCQITGCDNEVRPPDTVSVTVCEIPIEKESNYCEQCAFSEDPEVMEQIRNLDNKDPLPF